MNNVTIMKEGFTQLCPMKAQTNHVLQVNLHNLCTEGVSYFI